MTKFYGLVVTFAIFNGACTSDSDGSSSSDTGTDSGFNFDISTDVEDVPPDSSPDAAEDTQALDTDVPTDVSYETFSCAGYALALCSTLIRCEPFSDEVRNQLSSVTGPFRTSRECAERVLAFEGTASCLRAERGHANGTVVFDDAAADSCVQRIATIDCANFEAEWPELGSSCANAPFPTGLVPAGGDCVDNVECADGLACSALASDGSRVSDRGVCE